MASQPGNPFQSLHENLIGNTLTLSTHALGALERLTHLQLQVIKVTFDETGDNLAKVVQAADAASASEAVNQWLAPSGDKLCAWFQHLEQIASETGMELARDMEKQIAGNGSSLQAVLEAATVESSVSAQGVFPWMQPASFDGTAQTSSAPRHLETKPASRRPRNSDDSQVKRAGRRKKASPVNV